MAHRIQFAAQNRYARKIYVGDVRLEDVTQANTELWGDPRFSPGMHILSDLRSARVCLSFDDMVQYAASLECSPRSGKYAILVNRTVEYGCARMFESLAHGSTHWTELRIFQDEAEAEAWIDDPAPSHQHGRAAPGSAQLLEHAAIKSPAGEGPGGRSR